jgi:hypothetical protein
MPELVDQVDGIRLERLVVHAGVRDVEVEQGGQEVKNADDAERHFDRGVDRRVDDGEVEGQQGLPEDRAEDDGADRESLDPAVGDDQQAVRQVLGQDAVLGRRIRGGTEADDGVGEQRVNVEEQEEAAGDLDRVADEHDAPLRHRVGKGADEGGQGNVGHGEEELEQGLIARRRLHLAQGVDGGDQEGVVGQRGKELRRHDDEETEGHPGVRACLSLV